MSQIQREKRRFPRKVLQNPDAEVFDNDTGQAIGVLGDVSKGGFSILTEQIVRPSETRNVTLILPGPLNSAYRVSISAECVWCQTVNEQANFAAGFVLRSIEDQDEVALNYYIRDYQLVGQPQEA